MKTIDLILYHKISLVFLWEIEMEKGAIETRISSFAAGEGPAEPKISIECSEIMQAIEVVEKDSAAIAQSFNSLFSSLRLALSEVVSLFAGNFGSRCVFLNILW